MPQVNRALQNPRLFTSDHYRQAAIAVAAGIAIRIIVAIPVRFRPAWTFILKRMTLIDLGRWCACVAMAHITFRQHGPYHLGRKHRRWPALP